MHFWFVPYVAYASCKLTRVCGVFLARRTAGSCAASVTRACELVCFHVALSAYRVPRGAVHVLLSWSVCLCVCLCRVVCRPRLFCIVNIRRRDATFVQ